MRGKGGLSIVEVLIALGVLTSTFLAGTSQLITREKIARLDQHQSDASLVKGLIDKITSESALCDLNFPGKPRTSYSFNELVMEPGNPAPLRLGENYMNTKVRIDRLDFMAPDEFELDLVEGKKQFLGLLQAKLSWPRADNREETRRAIELDFNVPVLTDGAGVIERCNVRDHVLTDTLIDDDLKKEHAESACLSIGRTPPLNYSPLLPPERMDCDKGQVIISSGPFIPEALGRFYKSATYEGPSTQYPWHFADSVSVATLELPMRQVEITNRSDTIDTRTKLIKRSSDENYTVKVGKIAEEQNNLCFEDGKGCPPLRVKYTQCQTVQGPRHATVSQVSCPAGKYLINWWREVEDHLCPNYRYYIDPASFIECPGQPHLLTRATPVGYSYIKRTPTSLEVRFREPSGNPFFIPGGRAFHGRAAGECCRIEKL